MRFYVVCAWCGKLLRILECEALDKDTKTISHGICESCKARVQNEVNEINAKKPVVA